MAENCSTLVSVLDGHYHDLHKAGVPLFLCVHLKALGLRLNGAVWSARQSMSGFSISFY